MKFHQWLIDKEQKLLYGARFIVELPICVGDQEKIVDISDMIDYDFELCDNFNWLVTIDYNGHEDTHLVDHKNLRKIEEFFDFKYKRRER